MLDVQKRLGIKNMPEAVRSKIISILGVKKHCDEDFKNYKCSLQEITNNMKDNSKVKYNRNEIAEKINKNCRGVKKCKNEKDKSKKEQQRQNFKILIGSKEHDIFLIKEQSVLNKITTVLAKFQIHLQYSVLGYRIDAWFPKYKLAIEIDKLGHFNRDNEKEKTRENKIKQKLQCESIKINPDKEGFNIFVELAKISNYIADATCRNSHESCRNSIENFLLKI